MKALWQSVKRGFLGLAITTASALLVLSIASAEGWGVVVAIVPIGLAATGWWASGSAPSAGHGFLYGSAAIMVTGTPLALILAFLSAALGGASLDTILTENLPKEVPGFLGALVFVSGFSGIVGALRGWLRKGGRAA